MILVLEYLHLMCSVLLSYNFAPLQYVILSFCFLLSESAHLICWCSFLVCLYPIIPFWVFINVLHCLLSLFIYRCLMCGIFHWTFLPCVCFFYLVSALWLYLNVSLSHFPLSLRHTRCTSFVSFLYLSSTRFLRLWLYVSVHLPCKLLLYSHALAFSFRLLVIFDFIPVC